MPWVDIDEKQIWEPCGCVKSHYWQMSDGHWFLKDARDDPDCCCYLFEEEDSDSD